MAPEIVLKKDYSGFATDVWAMGVVLHLLVTGDYPFKGRTERELYLKIAKGAFSLPDLIHPEARRLIQRMLTIEPVKRPYNSSPSSF